MIVRCLSILALAIVSAGCFRYEPVATMSPAPAAARDADVRVSLTYGGTEDLRQYVGPNVESLDGKFLAAPDSSVELSVNSVAFRDGMAHSWAGERVRIPRAAIAQIEVRRFSSTRTLLLGVLAVAGAIAVNQAFGGPGNPHVSLPGPPPGAQ